MVISDLEVTEKKLRRACRNIFYQFYLSVANNKMWYFWFFFKAEPYYWVKSGSYSGYPNKAVVAGQDDDGKDVWVGRAKHDGQWTPAKVAHHKQTAYVPYGGKEHVKKDYEVNCIYLYLFAIENWFQYCQHIEKILVEAHDGPGLLWVEREGHYGIPAGAISSKGWIFTGESLYVGRAKHDGKLIPGKISPDLKCIFVPYGGLEHKITTTHEILVWKQDKWIYMYTLEWNTIDQWSMCLILTYNTFV